MNILILCEWDYCGCGFFLARAINRFTNHTAVQVRIHPSTLDFPCEIQGPSDSALLHLIQNCDVIHIHDDYRNMTNEIVKKPVVVTYHGTRYRRSQEKFNRRDKNRGWLQTMATIDLVVRSGVDEWMPDTRFLEDTEMDSGEQFSVCHTSTKRHIKSTDNVIKAIKTTGAKMNLVEMTQWELAMQIKRKSSITIDQFKLIYGCTSIESWMMGQPVICGGNKLVTDKIVSNFGRLPYVNCDDSVSSIEGAIRRLRDDKEYYNEMAQVGLQYVSKFHSPEVVAMRAIGYYKKAMSSFSG